MVAKKTKTTEARLLARARIDDVTGCWEWAGCKTPSGYGSIKVDGMTRRAHRVSYEVHRGLIPAGMCVCHRCDNPACINPEHLFLGSHIENMMDREAKGRTVKVFGTLQGLSKLTESDVLAIRAAVSDSNGTLSERYGVTKENISTIRRGKTWKHLV